MNLGEFRTLTKDLPDKVPLMYPASDERSGRCCWSPFVDVKLETNPYDKDDPVVMLTPCDDYDDRVALPSEPWLCPCGHRNEPFVWECVKCGELCRKRLDKNVWECGCGHVNGVNLDHCSRCGRYPGETP